MRTQSIAEIPSEWVPERSAALVKKTYHFELITPMMGGDAESWHLNLKAPIRAQSVKGHLRFWWRTMQDETDSHGLLYKENKIWGGKYGNSDELRNQSKVKVAVVNQHEIQYKTAFMENAYACDGSIIPKYVLFPITDKVRDGAEINFITKCKFDLVLSCPESIFMEVENALRLWCLFGGVGARTRRGTGSLYCPELLCMFEDENMLMAYLHKWTKSDGNVVRNESPYPILKGSRIWAKIYDGGDPADNWHGLLESYGTYRQGPGVGRKAGTPKPGRSFWPEPDRIRAITGRSEPRHSTPVNNEVWFPRAAFGLPIIFEFKDHGDPFKTELKPTQGSRWPSPMTLKVIRLTNGKIIRLGFVLNQKPPGQIRLSGQGHGLPYTLTANEGPLSQVPGRKMKAHAAQLQAGETPYEHLFHSLNLEDFT